MDVLANWLWQGCAVALAATVLMHAFPRISATTRYRGWWVALVLVLALPLIPAVLALRQADRAIVVPAASSPASFVVSLPPLPWWPVALMAAAWLLWTSASIARLLTALLALRRARAASVPFPTTREARLPAWLSIRSRGRRAALVVSAEVRSAGVLGLAAPAIAVAPVMLRELSDAELDQILVHEWAHVQRRDDLGRLAQLLVTAVTGLHPAVWWINRQLHIERETACDDWTVNVTGAAKRYAACLTKLATMGNDGVLVPAASSSSTLKTRVMRLLDHGRNRSTRFTVASLAIAPVLAAIAVAASTVELVVHRPVAFARSDRAALALQTLPQTTSAQPTDTTQPAPKRRRETPVRAPETMVMQSEPQLIASQVPATPPSTRDSQVKAVEPTVVDVTSLPGASEPAPTVPEKVGAATPSGAEKSTTPWGVAADAGVAVADAGVAVGRGSTKGAVATAGFFTRIGKSIARSF